MGFGLKITYLLGSLTDFTDILSNVRNFLSPVGLCFTHTFTDTRFPVLTRQNLCILSSVRTQRLKHNQQTARQQESIGR